MLKIQKWLHFIAVDQNKGKCNVCVKDGAAKDGKNNKLNLEKILISISSKIENMHFVLERQYISCCCSNSSQNIWHQKSIILELLSKPRYRNWRNKNFGTVPSPNCRLWGLCIGLRWTEADFGRFEPLQHWQDRLTFSTISTNIFIYKKKKLSAGATKSLKNRLQPATYILRSASFGMTFTVSRMQRKVFVQSKKADLTAG